VLLCDLGRNLTRRQEPRDGYLAFTAAGIGYTLSTSSPKWLMTFTAILPDCGGSNGWLLALYSLDHSPSSISARSAF
jgi:hypothetical protein